MWRAALKQIQPFRQLITKRSGSQAAPLKVLQDDSASDINLFQTGAKVHGFQVENVTKIAEFNITAVNLTHLATRAEYLHLYRNDSNNVFSVNFRTTPNDDTGVPHILEHTVLCGSKNYPVRDPFFKMLNRSLATFMNAMTGADITFYPFSTQNFVDYQNLQRIYLDAVFRPNLSQSDFMQEGWRLENTDLKDAKSDLIIKGVVYNEMKGAFAENERILEQKLQNLILPDHTYRYISGGDPLKIPDLTWEGLRHFHKIHYHPSNARFYSYGNFPLSSTLKFLNDEYLSHYQYQDSSHTLVPSQKRWENEQRFHLKCRYENMRGPLVKQNFVSISLLMPQVNEIYETFLLQFLTELLVKGPNAPFYKSMIEPNISGGFTRTTGYDTQAKDTIFTVGLQEVAKDDFEKVIALFDSTIDGVIKTGFDEKHIESVLHQYELTIKHEVSNFGLNLLFAVISLWNHNGNVTSTLQVNNLIERLRKEISADKEYLQKAVKKHFKDNKHKLILTMSADKNYEIELQTQEQNLIKEKTETLTADDKKAIFERCQQLEAERSAPQNTDLLPTLKIEDISSDVEKTPTEKLKIEKISTQINSVNSNGVTYFNTVINTSMLSQEQQMLLPLFCFVITKLGTKTYDYRHFDNLVNTKTAGLNLNVHIGNSLYQLHSYEAGLLLSSYCLDKNLESMFELWTEIFNINELKDITRFETLTKLYMSDLTQGLADSGHLYAMQAAAGLVSGSAQQKEVLRGLHHITYMKQLISTSNYKAILNEIVEIGRTVFDKNRIRCCLNITPENRQNLLKSYEKFINNLPSNKHSAPLEHTYTSGKIWSSPDAVSCQHHVLSVPVNYCSKAVLTAPYTNADFAKLRVLAKLLTAKFLHPEIREKQGAYGGGARLTDDGVFSFYSYRDPESLKTLDTFDNSTKWLEDELEKITPQEILEAKLGVFQAIDAPIPPSGKGLREFLLGLTPDVLQRHRAEVMAVSKEDLRQVAENYLASRVPSLCGKVVLGPKKENFDSKSRHDELWTVLET